MTAITAKTTYLDTISTLFNSGIRVILTRSREPVQTTMALQELSISRNVPFKSWSVLTGWRDQDLTVEDSAPKYDDVVQPLEAIKLVGGIGQKTPWESGIYVMENFHHWLKMPQILQAIQNYSMYFAESQNSLVLVVPMDAEIPSQVEDVLTIVDYGNPTQADLSRVYKEFMSICIPDNDPFNEEEVSAICSSGAAMTTSQFEGAVAEALVRNESEFKDNGTCPIQDFVDVINESKMEIVKRSEVLEVLPSSNMSEVGGLDLLKPWISSRKSCFSVEAEDFGIEKPKGIFLVGVPGSGKSLTAKVISSELGLPLIKFDISATFNSLVGSSEARVKQALKMIESCSPCVVLLDEIDKAGFSTSNQSGDSGVGKRVMGAILTAMQEKNNGAFWVFSANRVEGMPPELFRKGRLDEIFSLGLPNSLEREEILAIHLAKRKHSADDICLKEAVKRSDGYVASEIEAAVKEALILAYSEGKKFSGKYIVKALSEMVPMKDAFPEDFETIQQWSSSHARPASTPESALKTAKPSDCKNAKKGRRVISK